MSSPAVVQDITSPKPMDGLKKSIEIPLVIAEEPVEATIIEEQSGEEKSSNTNGQNTSNNYSMVLSKGEGRNSHAGRHQLKFSLNHT